MKRYFLVAVVVMFLFLSLGLSFASLNNGRPDNYPELGLGCTTARYIDRDCDGYGTGNAQNNTWLIGADADDTDAAVNTRATVIAKYGSVQKFINATKGYACDRYIVLEKGTSKSSHSPQTTLAAAEQTPYDSFGNFGGYQAGDCVVLRGTPNISSAIRYSGAAALYWVHGTQQKPLIIMAYPGERPIFADSGTIALKSWVTFDGLVFDRTNLSSAVSPDIASEGFTFRDCETFGDAGNSFTYTFQGLKHFLFEYNVFSGYNHQMGSHFIYLGNRAEGSGIDNATAIPSEDIVFRGNVFYNILDGIGMISYNGYIDNGTSGTGLLFEKNIFAENGGWALNLIMGVNDVVVRNNIFLAHEAIRTGWYSETSDYPSVGLHIKRFNMNNLQFYDNTVVTTDANMAGDTNAAGGFIFMYDQDPSGRSVNFSNFKVFNNIIRSFTTSANTPLRLEGRASFSDCSPTTPQIYNNLFYRTSQTNTMLLEGQYYALANGGWVVSGSQKCPSLWHNNVFGDPLFRNISNANYADLTKQNVLTMPSSPAKDMGASGGANEDIKGNTRTGYDAGAYSISAAAAVNYTVAKVRDNGNSSTHLDLCFIGSGYSLGQQATFDAKFNLWNSNLFATNWFANNSAKFNVWKFNVDSPSSGIALPLANIQIITGTQACDWVIVLHNFADGGYGYSQYYAFGQAPLNFMEFYAIDDNYLLAHELAHSFSYAAQSPAGVYIGDEYFENTQQPPCTGMSKYMFNSHDQPNNDKWSDLVSTPPYEGSSFCPTGLWRPTNTSVMRDTSKFQGFNPVVYKALDKSVGKLLGSVESNAPSLAVTGIVRDLTYSGTVTVGATVSDASGIERVEFYFGPYNGINWTGLYAQHSVKIDRTAPYSWDMNTSHYPDGRYAVDIFVYDNNWNVRRYMTWFNISNLYVNYSAEESLSVGSDGRDIFSCAWTGADPANTGVGDGLTGSSPNLYCPTGSSNCHQFTSEQSAVPPAGVVGEAGIAVPPGSLKFSIDNSGIGWNNKRNVLKYSDNTGTQDWLRFFTYGNGYDQAQFSFRAAFKPATLGGWVSGDEMDMFQGWWTGSTGNGPKVTLYLNVTNIEVRLWYPKEPSNTLVLATQTVNLGAPASIAGKWYQVTFLWRYNQPGSVGVNVKVWSGDAQTLIGQITGDNDGTNTRAAGVDTLRLTAKSRSGSFTTIYYDILKVKGSEVTSPTMTILAPRIGTVNSNGADTNGDGCIELSELISFVSRWQISSRDVSLADIIDAVKLWKGGCG